MKKILALLVVAGAATANAAVLDSNPQDFGANFGFGFYSDGDPGYFYSQQMAENFTLSSASNITGANWAGASEFFLFPDYTNMYGFQVMIMADSGGAPGAVLYAEDFATAATSPTLQGQNGLGSNVYAQSATFSSALNNVPAGNYWISIGGLLTSPGDDAWVWADGTNDDGLAYSLTPDSGGWTVFNDGATSGTFEVVGTVVPAPGSLALLGLGALAAGRRRR
ncbi:MAG: PEP-CTERM sorting domain-containing protein [Phycisphaerales bacterium]|nr:PEP-CTERM sorting domain-containing protein [Phycisphaerales bacterium]